MSIVSDRGRTALVAAGSVVLLGATIWAWSRDPAPAAPQWPAPEEIDSLSRYLAASEPAPRLDDYAMFLPAGPPPARASVPIREPAIPANLRVSAILITGGRPLAIINDRHVRPGQRVDGGAVVVSIDRDRVVVREPDGTLRTLRLATGDAE